RVLFSPGMLANPDMVERLKKIRAERLLVLTGAGISAESGLQTFRGQEGLWRQLDFRRFATKEAFEAEPARIWAWYQERRSRVRVAQPNAAHLAVATLASRVRDSLVVTQNVDDLHERGGLNLDRLVHIHGSILETRCDKCGSVTEANSNDASRSCA